LFHSNKDFTKRFSLITLLNVFKHEISQARQRYRLGTTHFATLKSFTPWHFDKKHSSEETPSYFELHITFSERSLQKGTQYSRNTTPVDTDLVTATGTAAISILQSNNQKKILIIKNFDPSLWANLKKAQISHLILWFALEILIKISGEIQPLYSNRHCTVQLILFVNN